VNVIMVNKFLYPKGGGETYAIRLGEELKRRGNDVAYFGMEDIENTVGNPWGLSVSPVDFSKVGLRQAFYPLRLIWSKDAYEKMRALIQYFHADIVHLNNFNYQLTPSIIDAAKAENVPVVVTAHDSQLLCPNHYLYIPATGEVCTRCVYGGTVNCIIHKCVHDSAAMSLVGAAEGMTYRLRDTYGYDSRIICPSMFIKRILDTDARFRWKTDYLINFSEDIPFKKVKKEGYVLYFGRLSPEKGMKSLLYAARMLPDIQFHIAGAGDASSFEKLPNVTVKGFLSGEDLYDEVRKAILSLVISTCTENCPMSIIESQILGTAVLTTGIGGAGELVSTRFQTKGTGPEAVAESIRKLSRHPEMITEMEKDGAERANRYLKLPQYAEKIEEIYARVSQ